jgi:thioredoxin 1
MNSVKDIKGFTEKILNVPGIQVVKFYADWSGPCQVMVPIYKELAASYKRVANFFTIDVEAAPLLKNKLGVIELPTILFYKNGIVVDFVNGMMSKNMLIKKMEDIVNKKNEKSGKEITNYLNN